jgi:hypothetical protein
VKSLYEVPNRARLAARELTIRCEDEPRHCLASGERIGLEAAKVRNILSDERPLFGESCREDFLIGSAFEAAVVGVVDGDDVVAARAELFGDGGRVHLVE